MQTDESLKARPAPEQTVSQDEVERLLAQVALREGAEEESGPGRSGESPIAGSVERHLFPRLSFFSPSELRKLRVRHEEFIHSLGARLSAFLRLDITLRMGKLETSAFDKFTEALLNPTHLSFVKLEPLAGICLVEIPPRLALAFVDRELGGPGVFLEEPRELGHVETRLLGHVLEVVVGEWCNAWSDMLDIRPLFLGQESSGRYVQTSPPDHTMLVVGIEVRLGELIEQIQLAFPYQTLESLLIKLNTGPGAGPKSIPHSPKSVLKWDPRMAALKILVRARLPALKLSAGQVASLRLGDTLPLPESFFQEVRVCLEKEPRFVGSFGSSGDRASVRIDRRLVTELPAAQPSS